MCDLSRKFGCDPEDALALARLGGRARHRCAGLFVPRRLPGGRRAQARRGDRGLCKLLAAARRRERLGTLDTLDIGGGFPIDYLQRAPDIGRFCAPIRAALAKLPKRVRVIAEPGRFIAGPAAIGVATVMGRARREGPLVVLPG